MLAPVLAPSSLPRGAAGRDLLSLAEQEGERGAEALLHVYAFPLGSLLIT